MNGQKQNFFRIFLAGVLILLSFAVYAQENTVTGKVYDVSGEPIIGASVVIQGTTQGTITDMDGAFQLKVQPSQSLVISFLGYQDVILPVGSKNNFKIIKETHIIRYNRYIELKDKMGYMFSEQQQEKLNACILFWKDLVESDKNLKIYLCQ